MSQNVDIARITAALNVPGLRYRSFGNDPVRIAEPSAAATAAPIPPRNRLTDDECLDPVADPDPTMDLLAAALSVAAMRPVAAAARFAVPPHAASPVVPVAMTPVAPSWAASPPAMPADDPAAENWPLLDLLRRPGMAAAEASPPHRAGTLERVVAGAAALAPHSGQVPASWPSAWQGSWQAGAAAGATLEAPGLLPATRVTAPLADLLQTLGRANAATDPALAALRIPGSGPVSH